MKEQTTLFARVMANFSDTPFLSRLVATNLTAFLLVLGSYLAFGSLILLHHTIGLKISQILLDCVSSLPDMLIAFTSASIGYYVRTVSRYTRSEARTADQFDGSTKLGLKLVGAGIIGVISYFILLSKLLILVPYKNIAGLEIEPSFFGVSIIAFFAGMFAHEIVGIVEGRFSQMAKAPPHNDGQ